MNKKLLLTLYSNRDIIEKLVRRAKHSIEMRCWIRPQAEMPAVLSGIFCGGK